MSDDIDAAVEVHRHELSGAAATLYAVQKVYGDKVREQSKGAYGRLADAHLLIRGVLAAALLRIHGNVTPNHGYQQTARCAFCLLRHRNESLRVCH